MKGQTQTKLINTAFAIIIIFMIFLSARVIFIVPNITNKDICMLEHGENWMYEKTKYFGATCIEVDYVRLEILDRVKMNITTLEASKKYCDRPGLFNLKIWDDGCVN